MSTNPEAVPVVGELGPQQLVAAAGPNGPTIKQFVCAVCDQRHYDMNHYFYGVDSIRCMWCNKYNKKRAVAKVATEQVVDPKD